MKARIETNKSETAENLFFSSAGKLTVDSPDFLKFNRVSEILTEGSESFRHYIEWLGLSRDPKLLVLSSIHHYYYDAEEMQSIRTVVNLKELNHIKEINNFLHSMFQILPPRCYLIGCFIDNKRQSGFSLRKRPAGTIRDGKDTHRVEGSGSSIPFFNTICNILDAKPFKYLTAKNVSQLLRNNGFKVMDMTELGGLTYFCAQTQRTISN